jgi:hypothetical protein
LDGIGRRDVVARWRVTLLRVTLLRVALLRVALRPHAAGSRLLHLESEVMTMTRMTRMKTMIVTGMTTIMKKMTIMTKTRMTTKIFT